MNIPERFAKQSFPPLRTAEGQPITTKEEHTAAKAYLKHVLEEYAYGQMPKAPDRISFSVVDEEQSPCAGKARLFHMKADILMEDKEFSFPFFAAIPTRCTAPMPALVYIRFWKPYCDKYLPLEEIIDRGYAVFSFTYTDVSTDDGDFTTGIAPYLCDRTRPNAPGKIALWAWAAMRVMDHVETRDDIDQKNVAVVGHSRLGKTALLAGGYDERFRYVVSNDSGCMGTSFTRGKIGESYERIAEVFPFWFCPRFVTEAAHANGIPYDQHFLLALTPPRTLLIGSAEEDTWADPAGEFLCLHKMNELYRLYGMRGLVTPDELPCAPYVSDHSGDASYHVRHGLHFMSREDFNVYLDYIDQRRTRQ